MSGSSQQEIQNWFNNMYRTKGFKYLRPQVAYQVFLNHIQAQNNQHLLDVACGLGLMLKTGDEFGLRTSGVDLSDEAIKICEKFVPNAHVHLANAEDLPFAKGTFDLITCLGSLERMLNLSKVLEQLHVVGNDNAKYCFMVRNSNTFIWRFFKQYLGLQNTSGHQDAKTLEEWLAIFERGSFVIESVTRDHWPTMRWKRWLSLGLIPVNYKKVPYSPIPIKYATEFVFVLKKQDNNSSTV
jgi:ubiquinone/menaquinone biosynthesis C-methylase UbiE